MSREKNHPAKMEITKYTGTIEAIVLDDLFAPSILAWGFSWSELSPPRTTLMSFSLAFLAVTMHEPKIKNDCNMVTDYNMDK